MAQHDPNKQWHYDSRYYSQRPIVIQQTTSPGTKVALWIIVTILGTPLALGVLLCIAMLFAGVIGASVQEPVNIP